MESQKGLVSIVMPSYNHAKYIGRTLEGLINQTYKNIELIIIDDGSTDNSKEVILAYEDILRKRFEGVTIIFQENKGVCKTINRGLRLAKGEFYCLVSSDDVHFPYFIEKHVSYLKTNEQFICSYSDGLDIDSEDIMNENYGKGILFSKIFEFREGNLRSYVLENDNITRLPTIAFVYRKVLLDEIGYYDENLAFEDTDMFYRITRNYQIGMLKDVLCLHRIHSYNSGRNPRVINKGMKQLYEKYKVDKIYSIEERNKVLTYLNQFVEPYLKDEILKNKKYLTYIKGREIVIWGASGGGKRFLKENPEINVSFFVDSDFQGKRIENYCIVSTEMLKGHADKYYLFISSSPRFYFEIKSKLEEYGYKHVIDFC